MPESSSITLIKIAILVPVLGYLILLLIALLLANRLVFPAPPAGYQDSPALRKYVYNDKGDAVTLWFQHTPGSRYLVYYHHGNGEDLQSIQPRLEALRRMGFSVLAWDYPGYGTSDGRSSEKQVLEIAEGIWKLIPDSFGFPTSQVLLYGRSVGGGPAIWLATRHEAAGLILEGTFTSIFRVALRINILPWDIFDNLDRIDQITCPALFMHGTHDWTVPFRHGKTLFENAPQPKYFAWFEGGGHNDLVESYPEIYHSSILRFTSSLDKGQ